MNDEKSTSSKPKSPIENHPNPQSPTPSPSPLRVAVVGPCSSGKSTLCAQLKAAGYEARHPAQEHSHVQDMWQRITKPDILIYLDLDYPTAIARRPHSDGGQKRVDDQHAKLAHAREHCDLYLDTCNLSPENVREQVIAFLNSLES